MASNAKRSRRIKQRIDPAERLARQIVPAAQTGRGEFVLRDVANHSDGDQRHSVRSGETKTVQRKTRIERLVASKTIDPHHAKALQWYANQHEAGYSTVGCTANYSGAGGGGFGSSDLLARHKAQAEARENYRWARSMIPASLVDWFEQVVIGRQALGRGGGRTEFRNRRAAFRLACDRLHIGIAHVVDVG